MEFKLVKSQLSGIRRKVNLNKPLFRNVLTVVVALLIFVLGINVGNGRLHLVGYSALNKSLPNRLDYTSVNEVYNDLKSQYDGSLNADQLINGLKSGLAQSTNDPYTEYMTASQYKQFNDAINGTLSGIGAQLGKDTNSNLQVIAPIPDTPASRAGIMPKDLILDINGKDTSQMTVDEAASKIRGPKGTQVTLTILRSDQQLTLTITRDNITVPSVNSKILDNNIGYIQVTEFNDDATNLIDKTAQSFQSAHVKGIILDLRNDPGGLVDSAVHISSMWLSNGKLIMQEKSGTKIVQSYNASGADLFHNIPTVVLINDGSASASEITAGALKDNGAAYIIGTTSYGKGVVQQIDNLSNGGVLKVTIAHWFRPNGQNINHIGIKPDQTVKDSNSQSASDQDPQKDAAIQYLLTKMH